MENKSVIIPLEAGVGLHCEIIERGAPRWIIMTHGIGEHSGRHHYLANLFTDNWNICFYDLRGHGRSSGKKAYIDQFEQYAKDLRSVISFLHEQYRMNSYTLIGHSMGALIISDFLQQERYSDFYPQKVFLCAPPVKIKGPLGKVLSQFTNMTSYLSRLGASIPLRGLIDLRLLSHDPQNYENYIADAHNALFLHSKLLLQLVNRSNIVFNAPLYAKCPVGVAVGSDDAIVDVKSFDYYFSNIEKVQMKEIIPGAYHELHNEINLYRTAYFTHLKNFIRYED